MFRIWQWLKALWKRLLPGKGSRCRLAVGELPGIAADLTEVDWSCRDVLVGSLGAKDQLEDNLLWKYYYVPVCYVSEGDLPIRYVAIYQSCHLFGEDSGIRYYGEVSSTELVRRWEIRFPVNRHNEQELYYVFGIREWKQLDRPISVRDEWVYEPRFANSFLLEQCRYSYELFGIASEQDFRLALVLREILEGSVESFSYQMGSNRILTLEKGTIRVLTGKGRQRDSLSVADLQESPTGCLCRLKMALQT